MAYDPYGYAGQYDYNQDPYGEYGYGYDDYGYGETYTQTLPPAPDINWVDPVKVNREYLKKIQKSCIHQGFEGLKEEGLFLLEIMVRSIFLKKDIFPNLMTKDTIETSLMVLVKFLDVPFVEVSERPTANTNKRKSTEENKTSSVLSYSKSFSNLFQCIYSCTGRHDSLIPEVDDEIEGWNYEEKEAKKNDNELDLTEKEKRVKIQDSKDEMEKVKFMKGKSILLPMPGLSMIQKLQQYPLILKMVRCDVTGEDKHAKEDIIATATIRLSETFRKSVLMSCKSETVVPLVSVTTNSHKLLDLAGEEVGEAEVTIVLTSFGKGAVNCMSKGEDVHHYEHTYLLKHLKAKHIIPEETVSPVDPRLAKEIIKMGLFFPSRKTSSEILQDCILSNLIPTDDEERKHALKKGTCGWFSIVKKVRPSSSSRCFDYDNYMKEMEMERTIMWIEHRKACRELDTNDPATRRISLEERFREVQTIQTGVLEIETKNPFEDLARTSFEEPSKESFMSTSSTHENPKK